MLLQVVKRSVLPKTDRQSVAVAAYILNTEGNNGIARLVATRLMAGVKMIVLLFVPFFFQ